MRDLFSALLSALKAASGLEKRAAVGVSCAAQMFSECK